MSLSRILNLKLSRFVPPFRKTSQFKTKLYMKSTLLEDNTQLDHLVKKYAPRLIYNTVIEKQIVRFEYLQKRKKIQAVGESQDPIPLTLKYLDDEITIKEEDLPQIPNSESEHLNFPYDTGISVDSVASDPNFHDQNSTPTDAAAAASEEVRQRYELQKDMKNWMQSYDNYDDHIEAAEDWKINYGTPDPRCRVSNVPCGGCGARLHCKDAAIPGYIPSEIYKNSDVNGGVNLKSIVCQRCHFLQTYNVALEVQVTPEDYPKVLATVGQQQGLVVLMVDLLDFPCSIWPGIGEIFGSGIAIVVVGNKVDLLPQDSKDFLNRIRTTLGNTVKSQGFATFNIKDVVLISAKTGYGIEELITILHNLHISTNVYIVGCTNVGKSTLFNALLQSDFCKTQALDLIQRATTSVWPGTTLNTLKFPIKRPAGYRQYLRHQRLVAMKKVETEEREFRKQQLRVTKNPKYATLIGHIDHTKNPYTVPNDTPSQDAFVLPTQGLGGTSKMTINERSREYAQSKWCYDTPGVVQPDQIIHLLTTEELLLTLPKEIIVPRTFCLKPKSTLFIGGLARLDYKEGPSSVRLTVFASEQLPITVCDVEDAEELYHELLGTDLFKVPFGDKERLSKWPKLELAKEFNIIGVNWKQSALDVVLSSAGWVALTGREKQKYHFLAWTPEKRGVHLRDCLLPHAVSLTGKRLKNSVAYDKFRFYLR